MSNKRKREYEVPDMVAFVERVARRIADRAEYDREALSGLQQLETAMRRELERAVTVAHTQNQQSWTDIGRELGITRQCAQQRFGKKETA